MRSLPSEDRTPAETRLTIGSAAKPPGAGGTTHPRAARDRLFFPPDLENAIRQPANFTLLEYWEERRGPLGVPPRAAFDVLGLRPWIGMLSLWDHDPGRADYRCRLFGSSETSRLKLEMTNRWVSGYPEGLGGYLVAQFDRVRDSAAPILVWMPRPVTGAMKADAKDLRAEKLLLPITRSGSAVDCILSQMVFFDNSDAIGQ